MWKMKIIFVAMIVISQLGLGILYFIEGNYKTFALGFLYAIANVVIFIL